MTEPGVIKASWLTDKEMFASSQRQTPDGRWLPARPIFIGPPFQRIKLAWRVFIGRYDVIDWEE